MKKSIIIFLTAVLAIVSIVLFGSTYLQPVANASTDNQDGQTASSGADEAGNTGSSAASLASNTHTANSNYPDGQSVAMNTNDSSSPTSLPPLEAGDLLGITGKIVAIGKNTATKGSFKLKSYRIEEITLTPASQVTINGQTRLVSKAWKVSVTGGPFIARDARAMIWANDQLLGYASESEQLDAISVITLDPVLLNQAQTLSLAYDAAITDRQVVPEKLDIDIKP